MVWMSQVEFRSRGAGGLLINLQQKTKSLMMKNQLWLDQPSVMGMRSLRMIYTTEKQYEYIYTTKPNVTKVDLVELPR